MFLLVLLSAIERNRFFKPEGISSMRSGTPPSVVADYVLVVKYPLAYKIVCQITCPYLN